MTSACSTQVYICLASRSVWWKRVTKPFRLPISSVSTYMYYLCMIHMLILGCDGSHFLAWPMHAAQKWGCIFCTYYRFCVGIYLCIIFDTNLTLISIRRNHTYIMQALSLSFATYSQDRSTVGWQSPRWCHVVLETVPATSSDCLGTRQRHFVHELSEITPLISKAREMMNPRTAWSVAGWLIHRAWDIITDHYSCIWRRPYSPPPSLLHVPPSLPHNHYLGYVINRLLAPTAMTSDKDLGWI